jgi:sugar O-acyltransferase (sialic acid O-acetyltransferase NeuD family)
MPDLVLFAAGSALIVDHIESARRAGLTVRAAVRNFDGPVYAEGVPVVDAAAIPEDLRTVPFLVPLFTPGHRKSAADEAMRLGFPDPATLVDPTAIVPAHLDIGPGGYINAGCTVGAAGRFGAFVLINRAASIGHHAQLGDFVSIGPGAVLAGQVTVETGAVIGACAVVLPEVTIGRNAVVGAGAVVTRDVPDEAMVTGNPARMVKAGIGGYKGIRVE